MPHSDLSSITTLAIDPHRLTVACPRRNADVPFDDCRTCGFGWLVHVDAEYGSSFVICESIPAEGPVRAAASMAEARITPVSEIMTRKVISVRASLSVERLILLLIDEDIGAVPVVDDRGRLIGMVSRDDLVTDDYDWADLRDDFLSYPGKANGADPLFVSELMMSRTVTDLMKPNVVQLPVTGSVAQAAAAIDANRVHELVVVDQAGELVGVVSKSDLVRWIAGAAATD